MAAGTRRRQVHFLSLHPVGRNTTSAPSVHNPKLLVILTKTGRLERVRRTPKFKPLRKPITFGVAAPKITHPKIRVQLAPRTSRTIRTLRGRFKFTPVFGYQTFKQPLYKTKVILVNRYAGKRPRPKVAVTFVKPVRFHNPIVAPVIRPKKLIKLLAPKRRFQKGRVIFLKHFGKPTVKVPVRPPKIVSLILRKRRLPQTQTRLGKVVQTFGVTNVPKPSSYIPTYRPRRR